MQTQNEILKYIDNQSGNTISVNVKDLLDNDFIPNDDKEIILQTTKWQQKLPAQNVKNASGGYSLPNDIKLPIVNVAIPQGQSINTDSIKAQFYPALISTNGTNYKAHCPIAYKLLQSSPSISPFSDKQVASGTDSMRVYTFLGLQSDNEALHNPKVFSEMIRPYLLNGMMGFGIVDKQTIGYRGNKGDAYPQTKDGEDKATNFDYIINQMDFKFNPSLDTCISSFIEQEGAFNNKYFKASYISFATFNNVANSSHDSELGNALNINGAIMIFQVADTKEDALNFIKATIHDSNYSYPADSENYKSVSILSNIAGLGLVSEDNLQTLATNDSDLDLNLAKDFFRLGMQIPLSYLYSMSIGAHSKGDIPSNISIISKFYEELQSDYETIICDDSGSETEQKHNGYFIALPQIEYSQEFIDAVGSENLPQREDVLSCNQARNILAYTQSDLNTIYSLLSDDSRGSISQSDFKAKFSATLDFELYSYNAIMQVVNEIEQGGKTTIEAKLSELFGAKRDIYKIKTLKPYYAKGVLSVRGLTQNTNHHNPAYLLWNNAYDAQSIQVEQFKNLQTQFPSDSYHKPKEQVASIGNVAINANALSSDEVLADVEYARIFKDLSGKDKMQSNIWAELPKVLEYKESETISINSSLSAFSKDLFYGKLKPKIAWGARIPLNLHKDIFLSKDNSLKIEWKLNDKAQQYYETEIVKNVDLDCDTLWIIPKSREIDSSFWNENELISGLIVTITATDSKENTATLELPFAITKPVILGAIVLNAKAKGIISPFAFVYGKSNIRYLNKDKTELKQLGFFGDLADVKICGAYMSQTPSHIYDKQTKKERKIPKLIWSYEDNSTKQNEVVYDSLNDETITIPKPLNLLDKNISGIDFNTQYQSIKTQNTITLFGNIMHCQKDANRSINQSDYASTYYRVAFKLDTLTHSNPRYPKTLLGVWQNCYVSYYFNEKKFAITNHSASAIKKSTTNYELEIDKWYMLDLTLIAQDNATTFWWQYRICEIPSDLMQLGDDSQWTILDSATSYISKYGGKNWHNLLCLNHHNTTLASAIWNAEHCKAIALKGVSESITTANLNELATQARQKAFTHIATKKLLTQDARTLYDRECENFDELIQSEFMRFGDSVEFNNANYPINNMIIDAQQMQKYYMVTFLTDNNVLLYDQLLSSLVNLDNLMCERTSGYEDSLYPVLDNGAWIVNKHPFVSYLQDELGLPYAYTYTRNVLFQGKTAIDKVATKETKNSTFTQSISYTAKENLFYKDSANYELINGILTSTNGKIWDTSLDYQREMWQYKPSYEYVAVNFYTQDALRNERNNYTAYFVSMGNFEIDLKEFVKQLNSNETETIEVDSISCGDNANVDLTQAYTKLADGSDFKLKSGERNGYTIKSVRNLGHIAHIPNGANAYPKDRVGINNDLIYAKGYWQTARATTMDLDSVYPTQSRGDNKDTAPIQSLYDSNYQQTKNFALASTYTNIPKNATIGSFKGALTFFDDCILDFVEHNGIWGANGAYYSTLTGGLNNMGKFSGFNSDSNIITHTNMFPYQAGIETQGFAGAVESTLSTLSTLKYFNITGYRGYYNLANVNVTKDTISIKRNAITGTQSNSDSQALLHRGKEYSTIRAIPMQDAYNYFLSPIGKDIVSNGVAIKDSMGSQFSYIKNAYFYMCYIHYETITNGKDSKWNCEEDNSLLDFGIPNRSVYGGNVLATQFLTLYYTFNTMFVPYNKWAMGLIDFDLVIPTQSASGNIIDKNSFITNNKKV